MGTVESARREPKLEFPFCLRLRGRRRRRRGRKYSCSSDPKRKRHKMLWVLSGGQTDSRDLLLQTPCCRQMGHVSCLRQYCEIPDECYDRTELKMIKNRVGVPRCFVCKNPTEVEHFLPIPLPKITKRVTSVTEANRVVDAWCNMFSRHLDNQTRRLKHLLTVEEVTDWAMRQDGRIEYDSCVIRIRYMKVDRFREEVKKATKRMIRKWAGLTPRAAKFTANTCNRFSLCDIT